MSRQTVTTILLWGGFAALIIGGFWMDHLERRRAEEARRALPSPSYAGAISEATARWAEDMREAEDPDGEIAALNDLWDSPAFGEGAER